MAHDSLSQKILSPVSYVILSIKAELNIWTHIMIQDLTDMNNKNQKLLKGCSKVLVRGHKINSLMTLEVISHQRVILRALMKVGKDM